jgi:hypothetical protein
MWVVLNYSEHFQMMMTEKDIELDETVVFWKEMWTHTHTHTHTHADSIDCL